MPMHPKKGSDWMRPDVSSHHQRHNVLSSGNEIWSVYAALVVGMITFLGLWLLPLLDMKSVMTATQRPDFSDSNFYLYHAVQNCRYPNFMSEFGVTWSSEGVVRYLTYTCLIFKNDFAFIGINALLFIFSYTYYLRSFSSSYIARGIILANSLCLYTICLFLAPGKEIISFVALCLAAGGVNRLDFAHSAKESLLPLMSLGVGILVAASSRPHEGLVIALTSAAYFAYRKLGLKALLIIAAVALVSVDTVMQSIIGQSFEDVIARPNSDRFATSDVIEATLTSNSPLFNAILSPGRVLSVPIGSFVQFFSNSEIAEWNYFLYRDVLQKLRAIDMILFYTGLYFSAKFWRRPLFFPFFLTVASLIVVTWTGVFEKSRYFFVYIPLLTPFIFIRERKFL